MSYTVWLDGTRIGGTSFEISHGENRRAGVFHPSAPGLPFLPAITAMGRALLDVGRMCRENGVDTEDPDLDVESAADAVLATPEGRRVQEAAKVAARLELHDARGELVEWESLLISDMNDFRGLAGEGDAKGRQRKDEPRGVDPIRYFITAKLRGSRCGATRTSRYRGMGEQLPQ